MIKTNSFFYHNGLFSFLGAQYQVSFNFIFEYDYCRASSLRRMKKITTFEPFDRLTDFRAVNGCGKVKFDVNRYSLPIPSIISQLFPKTVEKKPFHFGSCGVSFLFFALRPIKLASFPPFETCIFYRFSLCSKT